MKLVVLSKAGKTGLVPVQRQVAKKGKIFIQTFYVNPSDIPVPDKKPAVQNQKVQPASLPKDVTKDGTTIDPVVQREKNIGMIADMAVSRRDVVSWATTHSVDLSDPSLFDKAAINVVELGERRSGAMVVKYAVKMGVVIEYAKKHFMSKITESAEGGFGAVVFTDSSGRMWKNADSLMLGSWVNGNVKPNRDRAKQTFEARESGTADEGYERSFTAVLEKHLVEYTDPDQLLYRGTKNPTWADLVPGDVVPHGIGSFSKSQGAAESFMGTSRVMLAIDYNRSDEPVVGVDVNTIVEDAIDSGAEGVVHKYKIDRFRDEKEFIVLAPAFEVIEIEHVPLVSYTSRPDILTTLVHVRPVKMGLVSYKKSGQESRAELIAMAGRTFDYPMHGEPEDGWDSVGKLQKGIMKLVMHLSKAKSKLGLIPIKKQVRKKGKAYMQTFYVKPSDVPVPDKAPLVKVEKTKPAKSLKAPHWNMPDGFYILVQGDSDNPDVRARVKEEYVANSFKFRGRDLVVARAVRGEISDDSLRFEGWRVYDKRSGWPLTPMFEDKDSAKTMAQSHLGQIPDERFNQKMDSVEPVSSLPEYENELKYYDPKSPIGDFRDAAHRLKDKVYERGTHEGYSPEKQYPIEESKLAAWVATYCETNSDLEYVMNNSNATPAALYYAVKDDLNIEDSIDRERNLDKIVDSPLTREEVIEWATAEGLDLTDSFLIDRAEVYVDEYNERVPGVDVIQYAVQWSNQMSPMNMSLEIAKEHFEEKIMKQYSDESEFTDSVGKVWTLDDTQALGRWVNGAVEENRSMAKSMFASREAGDDVISGGTVMGMVERHLTNIETTGHSVIYRGTKNLSWKDLDPGDVVPFGMGSFSFSQVAAEEFQRSDVRIMLIMDNDEADEPVVGVDVNKMVDDAGEAGSTGLIHKYRINQYRNEKEFITMTPALEVLRVVKGTMAMNDEEVFEVYVKPKNMHLVSYLKSRFESKSELIAAAERTFDYPMHGEPEDI